MTVVRAQDPFTPDELLFEVTLAHTISRRDREQMWLPHAPALTPGVRIAVAQEWAAALLRSGYAVIEQLEQGGLTPAIMASLRDRATHTGTQLSASISDFMEAVQDAVASLLVSGANITLSYDDDQNRLVIDASGGDAEAVRDTIGAALVGVNGVSVAINDEQDTITIAVSSITMSQVTGLQSALASKQDIDGDLSAIAALNTTSFGRGLLTPADAPAARVLLGVGLAPVLFSAGTAVVGATGTDRAETARTITQARMRCSGAPVGSPLTVVVQHSTDGTAWTDVTTLSVAAGNTIEAVSGTLSQAQAVGHLLRLNCTSVGSTTPATGVVVDVIVV